MKAKALLISLALLMTVHAQTALAHPGGHGPVSEELAITIASEIAEQFIMQDPGLGFGKLSASWESLPAQAGRIHQRGDGYYIIALENRRESKTLYVLMSIEGEVFDANLSGEFPDLKQE